MELTFNGHACVTLKDSVGRTVVMDPYRSGALGGAIGHAPVTGTADVVTISHYHVDHSHVGPGLIGPDGNAPRIVDRAEQVGGLSFEARCTYHDQMLGAHMGLSTMFIVELDGLRVAHLGDIGCAPSEADARFLSGVDVLLWPVGGTYTLGPEHAQMMLDIVKPRLAIPLHFEHARCTLGMQPIDALPPHLNTPFERREQSSWDSAQWMPESSTVLALEPAL